MHCEVAPTSAPSARIGDSECGNWGVYGTLTLGPAGLAPTCDCSGTGGMLGQRCERECDEDADCGTGTCDAFGRCSCTRSCFSDSDCLLGTCDRSTTTCTGGWGDVRCRRALGNECETDEDCGAGVCDAEDKTCVCEPGYTGLRCEFQLAGVGQACTYSSDCDPNPVQVCDTDGKCLGSDGADCVSNKDCAIICREGACTYPGISPDDESDQAFGQQMEDMLQQFLTPEGITMFLAEEGLEKYASYLTAKFAGTQARNSMRLMVRAIYKSTRAYYRQRAAKVAIEGLGGTVRGYKTVGTSMRNASLFLKRSGIQAATKEAARISTKLFGALMFAVQVLGVVLDVMDTSGFRQQLSQDVVDTVMKSITQSINEQPALVEASVRYPMEYTPQETIEWRKQLSGDVMDARREELMQEYISSLDVNSNGATIIRDWLSPVEAAAQEAKGGGGGGVLWTLSGEAEPVYDGLKKWWWLIVVLGVVVVVCTGLGIGLSARKSK